MYKVLAGSLLLLLVFSGCVTINEPPPVQSVENTQPRKILNGLSKSEVISILGENVIVGYERKGGNSSEFQPIYLNNPYRSDLLKSGRKTFEVIYFFTGVKQPDDVVADNELKPMVFENDQLIGQDWAFLNQLKKRYKFSS